MQEREILLCSHADDRHIERAIDQAVIDTGLHVTMRSSLRKFPGSVHWHVKRAGESGTLEITFWPQQRRAWFSIRNGRQSEWIEKSMKALGETIGRRTGNK
jgi:hypothetical protein